MKKRLLAGVDMGEGFGQYMGGTEGKNERRWWYNSISIETILK